MPGRGRRGVVGSGLLVGSSAVRFFAYCSCFLSSVGLPQVGLDKMSRRA